MSEEKKKSEETEKDQKIKEKEKIVKTNPKKGKSKKTAIIIAIILLVVVIVVAIGGFFTYQQIEENKSVGTTWGDTYYAYLKEATEQKDLAEMEKYGLQTEMKNAKIEFCEIEENSNPAMVLSYEKEDKEYVNVYHIAEDGKVINVAYKDPSKIEFLYNISLQQYNWYIHTETNTQDSYKSITTAIKEINNGTAQEENTTLNDTKVAEIEAEHTIQKEEATTVEKVDGTMVTLSKFDETFIKPDIDGSKKVDFDVNTINEKELKKVVKETVEGYKTEEQVITEQVKPQIAEKVTAVETTKQEMETAKEEKAKKEEEERKITAENMQTKIGEHLKWAALVYLGSDYGLPTVYKMNDMTGKVSIPGVDASYMMSYEIVGLKSIQSLKNQVSSCLSSNAISKLSNSMWGSYTNGLKEYNGKVYLCRGGIGAGPSIDVKKAKLLSSENGVSKVQLSDINELGDVLEATITLTIEHNKDTGKYIITDGVIKNAN